MTGSTRERERENNAPEAGQGKPAGQQPGSVGEASVQVGVQLGHLLVQHATDLFPMKAAAGSQNNELRQGVKQVWGEEGGWDRERE